MKYLRGTRLTYFNVCCRHNTLKTGISYERNHSFPVNLSCLYPPFYTDMDPVVLKLLFYRDIYPFTCIFRLFTVCLRYESIGFCRQPAGLLNRSFVVIAATPGPLLTFDKHMWLKGASTGSSITARILPASITFRFSSWDTLYTQSHFLREREETTPNTNQPKWIFLDC